MSDWLTIDALRPWVVLRYPSRTRSGQVVDAPIHAHDGVRQAHPQSADKKEVYFEVVVYEAPIEIERMYERQRRFILAEDERKTNGFVGDLEHAMLLGRDARRAPVRFEADGDRFERLFYFVNVDDVSRPFGLRVVFDPRSSTNFEILDRLEIAAG